MSELNVELDRQSLRGFLAQLEKELPEDLLRIREPVRTKLEMTSLVFELERLGRSPVVVFENVEGHTMPVVTNIAANRRVLAWHSASRRRNCRRRSASAAPATSPSSRSTARRGTT